MIYWIKWQTRVGQNGGYIDAFSAVKNVLFQAAVYLSCFKILHPDHVIQRGIQCYGINHGCFASYFIKVSGLLQNY